MGRAEGKRASLQPQEAVQGLGPGVPRRTERNCSARSLPGVASVGLQRPLRISAWHGLGSKLKHECREEGGKERRGFKMLPEILMPTCA